jgi:hypothetical protein
MQSRKKIVSQIIISDYGMQFKAASGMDFFTLSRRILHGRAGANFGEAISGLHSKQLPYFVGLPNFWCGRCWL